MFIYDLEDAFIRECDKIIENILNREYTDEQKDFFFKTAFDNHIEWCVVARDKPITEWDKWQGFHLVLKSLDDLDYEFGFDFSEELPLGMDFEDLLERINGMDCVGEANPNYKAVFNRYIELREEWLKNKS